MHLAIESSVLVGFGYAFYPLMAVKATFRFNKRDFGAVSNRQEAAP